MNREIIEAKKQYLNVLKRQILAGYQGLAQTIDPTVKPVIEENISDLVQKSKELENELDQEIKQIESLEQSSPKWKFIYGELFNSLPFGKSSIIEHIRKNSRNFIRKYISDSCLDYIQHSLNHPDRAIILLNDWLLDEEQKDYLEKNKWTIFFLYASLYLYDIGISSPPRLHAPQSLPNTRSQILKSRAKRAEKIINSYWEELGIENKTQAQWIAKICECQEINLDSSEFHHLEMSYGTPGERIDLPFIVSCIKIIHNLDLDPEIAPERIPFLFERFLPNASRIIANHFNFWGIPLHRDDNGEFKNEIRASLDCDDIETHRAFKQHEGLVQTILNEANRNLTHRFRYTEVFYAINNHNYEPIDFKFKVETSAALEIFMGTPIYTQEATFLRELIQNSIDACQVRSISNPSYQPKISVERKPDFQTVIIKDNGIGMDKYIVEKYFLPIGISFYRSEDFEKKRSLDVGFSPISRFGIGILSCFMVAEKIILRTKKQGSIGLEIEIYDFRNYFVVKQYDSLEQGTEIVVTLKPDYTEIDCLSFLQENIKCTKYPIEYIYFNGERKEIAQEPVSLVSKLQQKFWSDEWENYIEETIPLSSPNSEGYIAFNISYDTADSSTDETYIDDDETYIDEAYPRVSQFFTSAILKGSETFVFWLLLGMIVQKWVVSLAYPYYIYEADLDENDEANLDGNDEADLDETDEDDLDETNEADLDENDEADLDKNDEADLDETDEADLDETDFNSGYMSVCEVYVFQDGIYICNEPRLLPEWITSNIICRINLLDGDRLDLAISRSGLIQNSKYFSLKQILNGSLVLLFSKVFEKLKSQYQEREDYQISLKSIVEQNFKISDDVALIKLLKNFYCFTLLTSDKQVLDCYFYDEFPQLKKKIVIFIDEKRFIEKNIQLYKKENPCFIVGEDARIINLIDKKGRYERVEQRLRRIDLVDRRGLLGEIIPDQLQSLS